MSRKILVIGDGSWGSALAHVARRAGHDVAVWSRKSPDARMLKTADAVIVAVPAQAVRLERTEVPLPLLGRCHHSRQRHWNAGPGTSCIRWCAAVCRRIPRSFSQARSFAADVLKGKPTAVTQHCGPGVDLANEWAATPSARSTSASSASDDVLVWCPRAMKNVLAIACGISMDGAWRQRIASRTHHPQLCRTHALWTGTGRGRRP